MAPSKNKIPPNRPHNVSRIFAIFIACPSQQLYASQIGTVTKNVEFLEYIPAVCILTQCILCQSATEIHRPGHYHSWGRDTGVTWPWVAFFGGQPCHCCSGTAPLIALCPLQKWPELCSDQVEKVFWSPRRLTSGPQNTFKELRIALKGHFQFSKKPRSDSQKAFWSPGGFPWASENLTRPYNGISSFW